MAFTYATLAKANVGAPSGIAGVWAYTTADSAADVVGSNYWAGAYARGLRATDMVLCSCSDGGIVVYISALAAGGTTSTAATLGALDPTDFAALAPIWVGPIDCQTLETAQVVGTGIAPITGTITEWYFLTDEATNTADSILNLQVNAGSNCAGTITVDKDDAAGTVGHADVTTNNAVTAGDVIKIESDGGASSTGAGRAWIKIDPTA